MDARAILWTDTGTYRRRYEKTANALIAVERALRSSRPLGGAEDEFLDLYRLVASADPQRFTQVWQDPFAYFWARLAYELVGSCVNSTPPPPRLERYCVALGASEPAGALALHLEEFKRLVLALEMISGRDRHFRRPLETRLPFSIPGSRYSVIGAGAIQVSDIVDGTLEAVHDGRPVRLRPGAAVIGPEMPQLVTRPIVRRGECELVLKAEAFFLPGVDAADALRDLPGRFQEQQIALLEDALALIERHQPSTFEHLAEVGRVIALKPAAAGDYSNVSYSDLPGAFILTAVEDAYWIADALIHELFHNRLFFIEDGQRILVEPDEGEEVADFYSPWRDELRPLSGLLHALYVYIPVCRFWLSVWRSAETSGLRKAYVEDQAIRGSLQIRIAARQLRRYARFTDFGAELFKELATEVEAVRATVDGLRLSPVAPAMITRADGQIVVGGVGPDGRPLTVVDTIRHHVKRYDVRGQCGDLEAILNRS